MSFLKEWGGRWFRRQQDWISPDLGQSGVGSDVRRTEVSEEADSSSALNSLKYAQDAIADRVTIEAVQVCICHIFC